MQKKVAVAGVADADRRILPWAVGPKGERLILEDLPAPGERWNAFRKAQVVAAVEGNLLTQSDALARYNLTIEEFSGWLRCAQHFGVKGLRATHAVHYRKRITRATQWTQPLGEA
ncbi:DUF1153 domain-containing protein [Sphingobium sufflavum]|uniref:DUF1153 domain-containing protein n=1 Tax=Sphingobium sufflavum TaxID=1129547 RepID=UPI001F362D8E|nr:DUF1153 domain-containing protein [Sphingobium sufflavum]MCE7797067.1 DUF1153 domain-containing protein [Sphingobium sufflavum]